MNMSAFTLVIVTWNGDEVLKPCLDSLVRVYGQLPETVVVDNASLDSTREIVGKYENARYLALPENMGFAGGNNAALPFCNRKYIVFLNNDTEFKDDSISPLLSFLEAHPKCGAVQGTVVLARRPKILDGCGGFLSPIGTLAFRGAFVENDGTLDCPEHVFAIGGCFFAARRETIESCGGLFYDHFKSYYEEIDFCHRLNLAGYECWYVPTSIVLHKHSITANKLPRPEVLRQYYRNIWFSFRTCFGAFARIYFCSWLFLLCIGQSLAKMFTGNFSYVRIHCLVFTDYMRDIPLVMKTRRSVNKFRHVPDRKLLKFAVRSQPMSYYATLLGRS